MEEFPVKQIDEEDEEQGELEEVLDIAHEHMFSCTTPGVVTAVTREQAVVVEHMTITTVDCNHTGNYGNGDIAQEANQGGMTEVSYGDGEALIGQSVIKRFSRKKYMGHIVAYDPNTKWYKVSFALTPDPCITSLLKI
jgi:hypothetical protein